MGFQYLAVAVKRNGHLASIPVAIETAYNEEDDDQINI